jgi:hypothetical protein
MTSRSWSSYKERKILDKMIFTLNDLLADEEDSLSSMSLDDDDDDEYDIDSDVSSVESSDASSVSTVTSLFQKIISFANHLFGPKKNLIQYVSYQFAMTIDSLPNNNYINVKEFRFKKAHPHRRCCLHFPNCSSMMDHKEQLGEYYRQQHDLSVVAMPYRLD